MGTKTEKKKLTSRQYLTGLVCAMNNTAAWGILYFVSAYYAVYQDATGFSDAQITTILGYTSATAMISYIFGGVIADAFRPRHALNFCCVSTAVLAVGMLMFTRNYQVMRMIGMVLSITCLMTSWAPSSKFLALAGTPEETGRIFGFYNSMLGLTGFVVGIVGSALTAASGSELAYRIMIILYIVMLFICMLLLPKVDPTDKNEVKTKGKKAGGFKLQYVLALLKTPEQWLGWFVSLGLYISSIAVIYTSPILTGNFLVSVAFVTLLTTIRSKAFGFIFNPIFGSLIDRLGSPMKVQAILYTTFIAGLLIMIVLPWGPELSVVGVIAVLLMAITNCSQSTCSSAMLTKIGTPHEYRGTAVGIQSVFLNAPSPLLYAVVASLLTKQGVVQGYKSFYCVILGVVLVGFVCLLVLMKRVAKKEAAQA